MANIVKRIKDKWADIDTSWLKFEALYWLVILTLGPFAVLGAIAFFISEGFRVGYSLAKQWNESGV